MSAKKLPLSNKEYQKIFLRLIQARKELNEKFIKAMKAGASVQEYGEIFLRYLNKFKNNAEKIVAIVDIFFLGLNVRKVADDAEAEERELDKRIADMIEGVKKSGKMPTS